MPLITKGGKFIYGWSKIKDDLSIQLPSAAIKEYDITSEGKVFLISGSKQTGGFVITRKGLLLNSKIGNILKETPMLCDYKTVEGEFIRYKGRLYTWCNITETGELKLGYKMLNALGLNVGNMFLVIRSSDIAFCLGAKGEIIERVKDYDGEIDIF